MCKIEKLKAQLICILVVGLIPYCLVDTVLSQNVNSDLEQRIAQTLLNTIKGRSVEIPPTAQRIEEFRNSVSSKVGIAWGVNNEVKSSIDGKKIKVMLSVTVLPDGYSPAEKELAGWKRVLVPNTNHPSGAEIGFNAGGSQVRRNKVFYRLKKGSILLRMDVTRKGDETAEQAIAKTSKNFTKFVKFAAQQKLFEEAEARIDVSYLPSDDSNEVVENGSVVQAPYNGGESTEVVFNVSAISPLIPDDEPFSIDVQLESKTGAESATFVDGFGQVLRDSNRDGWNELAASRGKPSQLILRMKNFDSSKSKDGPIALEQFVVGRIRIRTSEDGETITMTFGVQRRSWHVIVQRFEIMGFDYGKTDQEFRNSQDVTYDLDGRLGFNDYVGNSGTLVQNFDELLAKMASPRGPIAADAPVCMSWQRDHHSGKAYEFLVAKDAADIQNRLPAIGKTKRMNLVVDFKITQPPKRTSLNSPAPVDAGDFGVDAGEEEEIDGLAEEIKLRRKISFEKLLITRHIIEEKPNSMSPQAFMDQISTSLRKPPNRKSNLWKYQISDIMDRDRQLDTGFPLTNRYLNPDALNSDDRMPAHSPKGIRLAPHRFVGTFELRMQAELAMLGDNEPRKVDVAIRYAVAPANFKILLLDWTTKRASVLGGRK